MFKYIKNLSDWFDRWLYSKPEEAPTEQKPHNSGAPKVTIRIAPHNSRGDYFCIEYRISPSLTWKRIGQFWDTTDFDYRNPEKDMRYDFPIMLECREEAANFAKKHFKSLEDIKRYEKEQRDMYDEMLPVRMKQYREYKEKKLSRVEWEIS